MKENHATSSYFRLLKVLLGHIFVLPVLSFIDILGHIIAIGALDILVRIADTIVVFVQGVAVTTRFGLGMEKEHEV